MSSAGKQVVRRVRRGLTLRTGVSRRGADTVVEGSKAGAKTGTEPRKGDPGEARQRSLLGADTRRRATQDPVRKRTVD